MTNREVLDQKLNYYKQAYMQMPNSPQNGLTQVQSQISKFDCLSNNQGLFPVTTDRDRKKLESTERFGGTMSSNGLNNLLENHPSQGLLQAATDQNIGLKLKKMVSDSTTENTQSNLAATKP